MLRAANNYNAKCGSHKVESAVVLVGCESKIIVSNGAKVNTVNLPDLSSLSSICIVLCLSGIRVKSARRLGLLPATGTNKTQADESVQHIHARTRYEMLWKTSLT